MGKNEKAVLLPKDLQDAAAAEVDEPVKTAPATTEPAKTEAPDTEAQPESEAQEPQPELVSEPAPPVRAPPTSWANLFAKTPVAAVVSLNGEHDADETNSSVAAESTGVITSTLKASANSVAEAIRSYKVGGAEQKEVFLEPRGLINTGNMCYMNSVCQTAVFIRRLLIAIGPPSSHVLLAILRFPWSSQQTRRPQLQERDSSS